MTNVTPNLFGRSGWSDDQLAEMWRELRALYPEACARLADPLGEQDMEEDKRRTSFIQSHLNIHRPDIKIWPDRHYVYCDLLDFFGRHGPLQAS
jgi:hypothetical protein